MVLTLSILSSSGKDTTDSQGLTIPWHMMGSTYLLLSNALDSCGFTYVDGPPSYFFLDPTMPWESVEALVNVTFSFRELAGFKRLGQADHPTLFGAPPPLEVFKTMGTPYCSSLLT